MRKACCAAPSPVARCTAPVGQGESVGVPLEDREGRGQDAPAPGRRGPPRSARTSASRIRARCPDGSAAPKARASTWLPRQMPSTARSASVKARISAGKRGQVGVRCHRPAPIARRRRRPAHRVRPALRAGGRPAQGWKRSISAACFVQRDADLAVMGDPRCSRRWRRAWSPRPFGCRHSITMRVQRSSQGAAIGLAFARGAVKQGTAKRTRSRRLPWRFARLLPLTTCFWCRLPATCCRRMPIRRPSSPSRSG